MSMVVATLWWTLGCKGSAEETGPSIAVGATELAFGDVTVGETVTETFTIENDGGTEWEILSASLIEGRSSVWTIERTGEDLLVPGDTVDVFVTFAPYQDGEELGRIQLRTTLEEDANHYVSVAGTGGSSRIDGDGDGVSPADGDCDDENSTVYPGAAELCDGLDNDCDDVIPEDETDGDYDAWMLCEDDCDDEDGTVYPGAPELCDDLDTDCDGAIPDRDDADGDGYSLCEDDCDDDDPDRFPGNVEVCDFVDNDCSNGVDDIDVDGDGHSPCTGGGDCDDTDYLAHPVIVDSSSGDDKDGDGTQGAPYQTVDVAIENLDEVCRTILLIEGYHETSESWDDGFLRIQGAGEYPDDTILWSDLMTKPVLEVQEGSIVEVVNLTLLGNGGEIDGDGGSIYAFGADLTLDNVVAVDNACSGDGGAIAVSSGTLTVRDTIFQENVAGDDGGAIALTSSSFYDEGGCSYTGNTGDRGGAIAAVSTQVEMVGASFYQNQAGQDGGGIMIQASNHVLIEQVAFWENYGEEQGGGLGLSDVDDPDGYVRNSWFVDNEGGERGAGIAVDGNEAALMIANNTLAGNANYATNRDGGGIWIGVESAPELYAWSNIVSHTEAASGIYSEAFNEADIRYNLVFSTASGINYDIDECPTCGNITNEDPYYVDFNHDGDATNDDLTLQAVSPAVDAGPSDGEGPDSYTIWADLDGSQNDMGATGGPGAE